MKKNHEEKKVEKKLYEKPGLTRHGKLNDVVAGVPSY